jgi:hypothetical protein
MCSSVIEGLLRVNRDRVEPTAARAMSAFLRLRSSFVLQQNFAMRHADVPT